MILSAPLSEFDVWKYREDGTFTNTTTSGIDSPTVMKRDLQTVLIAKSGDVIIMGRHGRKP